MAVATPVLHAGIVAEALFSFPADTEYVEYDNLAVLRATPEYNKLRHNFSGNAAEEAASVLAQLGIPESEVREVVNASDAKVSFGTPERLIQQRIVAQRRIREAQRFAPSR